MVGLCCGRKPGPVPLPQPESRADWGAARAAPALGIRHLHGDGTLAQEWELAQWTPWLGQAGYCGGAGDWFLWHCWDMELPEMGSWVASRGGWWRLRPDSPSGPSQFGPKSRRDRCPFSGGTRKVRVCFTMYLEHRQSWHSGLLPELVPAITYVQLPVQCVC